MSFSGCDQYSATEHGCDYNHAKSASPGGASKKLEWLYRTYYADLLQRLRVSGVVNEDAEDLIQDIFVRLAKTPDLSNVDAAPRAYLYRSLTNGLVDRSRRARVRPAALDRHLDDLVVPSDDPSAERILQARHALQRVRRVISALKPKSRAIFEMHRFQEMTHHEIGKAVNLSPRSIEHYIKNAVSACRQAVDEGDALHR